MQADGRLARAQRSGERSVPCQSKASDRSSATLSLRARCVAARRLGSFPTLRGELMAHHDLSRSTFPLEYVRLSYDADGFLVPQDCPECGAIASVERGDDWWKCRSCSFVWIDSDELVGVVELLADGTGDFMPLGPEQIFDELADPDFCQSIVDELGDVEPDENPPF